ncbi:MAG: hypothetical protein HYV75_08270, partial [Opitutae bacterium]|nr:hypothetical protein [Opitutae bacterium]
DLQRHLEHRPVAAHRPDPFYRLGKFIRRQRSNLAIAGGALLFGLAGGLWFYWQSPPVGVPAPTAQASGKVGLLGDLDSITFSGNRTFSARAIRSALADDNNIILAAHSEAPLDEFIEVTRQAVLHGYRGLGFPEATITARANPDRQRLEVTVVEGPRFVRGEVQVFGTSNVPAADIVRVLTTPRSIGLDRLALMVSSFQVRQGKIDQAADALQAMRQNPGAGSSSPSAGALSKPSDQPDLFAPRMRSNHALWVAGTPASFADESLQELVTAVHELLDERGLPLADVQVNTETDPATGRAGLRVQVQEGSPATVGAIHVRGNTRNTADEIIRCTGLAPGMKLDTVTVTRTNVALWSSSRSTRAMTCRRCARRCRATRWRSSGSPTG